MTHGIRGGYDTYGYTTQRKEKEKKQRENMSKNRTNTGDACPTSNHQQQRRNQHQELINAWNDLSHELKQRKQKSIRMRRVYLRVCGSPFVLVIVSLVQWLSSGAACPKQTVSTGSRSAVAPRDAWGRCCPICEYPGGLSGWNLCPATPVVLLKAGRWSGGWRCG